MVCCYLANDGELGPVDMVAVDAQGEDGSQSHHAAHGGHVVEVGLGVLDVSATRTGRKQTDAVTVSGLEHVRLLV